MYIQGSAVEHGAVEHDGHAAYETADLHFLRQVLDEILGDLRKSAGASFSPSDEKDLEVRLAAALFDCARPGEREGLRLKTRALMKVAATRAADH